MTTFEDLQLIEPLLRAVAAENYHRPTPIQAKAIPLLLAGRDVLGCAQTGTGKTAAFALPVLQHLALSLREAADADSRGQGLATRLSSRDAQAHSASAGAPDAARDNHAQRSREAHVHPPRRHRRESVQHRPIRALVLSPTRELAAQIGEHFRVYGRYLRVRHSVIFGGVSQFGQEQALRRGIDVLVATPGRLLDLQRQGLIDLGHVDFFVLDEADRMLDMGFIHDIRAVLALLPKKRQNLLFSATLPESIVELAGGFLHDPARVEVTPPSSTVEMIEQSVMFVEKGDKQRLLEHLITSLGVSQAIVFTRTKHGANRVVKNLDRAGIRSAAIHGNKSQNARTRALDGFRNGELPILVATDIASRGIDVDGVSHVFNYDLPNEPEVYVHRIGRTGRAGRSGIAVAFCDQTEGEFLCDIEKLTGIKIPVVTDQPWHYPAAIPTPAVVRRGARPAQPERRQSEGQRGRRPRREVHPAQLHLDSREAREGRGPRRERSRDDEREGRPASTDGRSQQTREPRRERPRDAQSEQRGPRPNAAAGESREPRRERPRDAQSEQRGPRPSAAAGESREPRRERTRDRQPDRRPQAPQAAQRESSSQRPERSQDPRPERRPPRPEPETARSDAARPRAPWDSNVGQTNSDLRPGRRRRYLS